jgi:hypothetical protein
MKSIHFITIALVGVTLITLSGLFIFHEIMKTSSSGQYIFNGEGVMITEIFYIPSQEWKIKYEILDREIESSDRAGVFVCVHSEDGDMIMIYTYEGISPDYTIIHHGPGEYYLDITGYNSVWRITVTSLD